eukprot:scaffold46816_cov66-Phaeocystis_antarctica.AAC.2
MSFWSNTPERVSRLQAEGPPAPALLQPELVQAPIELIAGFTSFCRALRSYAALNDVVALQA